jgi:CheY-like chemotaxis protein
MKIKESKNIFLIDDDPVNNMLNTRIIEKHTGLKVKVYDDAFEALRDLQHNPTGLPEFIFLDINMPEMNGWDFLEKFQMLPSHIRNNCPIVMLTSSIDHADIRKAQTYSVVQDFVSKPLTTDRLASLAQELLK